MSGLVSHCAGMCAEDSVAAHYERRGFRILRRRWRGRAGEIDVIAEGSDGLVFVEVKASRTHARAAENLGRRQIARLYAAASEFLADMPGGQDTDMRFDVALMDGTGEIDIVENAFM